VNFCPQCGQNLTRVQCPECKTELDRGWRHCVNCGATLHDP
jgi:predicted amidophosphoribosyltransferase